MQNSQCRIGCNMTSPTCILIGVLQPFLIYHALEWYLGTPTFGLLMWERLPTQVQPSSPGQKIFMSALRTSPNSENMLTRYIDYMHLFLELLALQRHRRMNLRYSIFPGPADGRVSNIIRDRRADSEGRSIPPPGRSLEALVSSLPQSPGGRLPN